MTDDACFALQKTASQLYHDGRFLESADYYRQARALRPQNLGIAHQEALSLRDGGDHRGYHRLVGEILAQKPDYAEVRASLAFQLLAEGRFKEAMAHWEARLVLPGAKRQDLPERLRWKGRPLTKGSLGFVAEQGLGDTIQFLRYAPLLREMNHQVVLEVAPPLRGLVAANPHLGPQIPQGETVSVSRWCHMMDVLALFEHDFDTIPKHTPYIFAPPSVEVPEPVRRAKTGLRVGIAWAGSATNPRDRHRSTRLETFAPLLDLDGVDVFTLSPAPHGLDVARAGWSDRVIDLCPYDLPFEGTAQIVAHLDLVIAVDTSVIHLAAAMGKPAWVLLSTLPDWRWGFAGDRSPWYQSVRIFRQTRLGDWGPVMAEVAAALRGWTSPGA
ncbi:MAG: glycosyltransferase family 9 protein [Maricaulaceae bacterium]